MLREKRLEYEAEPVTAEEDAADMVVAAVAAEGGQIDAPDDPMAVAVEGEQNDAHDDPIDKNQTLPPPTIIQTEYRPLQRGVPSTMLTEERVAQLQNVGFEFSTKLDMSVPDLDWSTRIHQLEAFQYEMGHLRVDP